MSAGARPGEGATRSGQPPFHKILVANRGEIACRAIREIQALGASAVAVYSEADAEAPHVRLADEAVLVGPPPAEESYLNQQAILNVASRTGAEAVYPGYGFLSENAEFAMAVGERGLAWIGPPPETISRMGDKVLARAIAEEAGVPVVPGSGVLGDDEAAEAAEDIGYPLMVKAAAGGGGIGMQVVDAPEKLEKVLTATKSRAASAFGNDDIYLERLIQRPRHVEVQIMGDAYGNLVHLGTRECSIQRRHQKVVEEALAPHMPAGMFAEMTAAALRLVGAIEYAGPGTVEFMVDGEEFYFLEMNTRLQVEHPVTECVTGLNLVAWQITFAVGEELGRTQEEIPFTGHAIEARIYAENPKKRFFPSPGRLEEVSFPDMEDVRVDSGVTSGQTVTPHYDPLLAKLIVWDETRERAVGRLAEALDATRVKGLVTNVEFLRELAADEVFRSGRVDTKYVSEHLGYG